MLSKTLRLLIFEGLMGQVILKIIFFRYRSDQMDSKKTNKKPTFDRFFTSVQSKFPNQHQKYFISSLSSGRPASAR